MKFYDEMCNFDKKKFFVKLCLCIQVLRMLLLILQNDPVYWKEVTGKANRRRHTKNIIRFHGKEILKQIYDIYFVLYNILHENENEFR